MTYPIYYHNDELTDGTPCIIAIHRELPGCYGFGATREEAKRRLDEAREAYVDAMVAAGETPPPAPWGRVPGASQASVEASYFDEEREAGRKLATA